MYASAEEFIERCGAAAQEILKHIEKDNVIAIFSHDDADGIAAGSIMAKAVYRLGGRFHLRVIDRLDEAFIDEVRKIDSEIYVFAEIGSGYLDLLKPLSTSTLAVLDHHKPLESDYPNLIHVNPHYHGIDGASQVSGAGVCYLVAKKLSQENIDLSCLAVVGALGDLQDKNENRTLRGLNELIVKDAEGAGLLEVATDLLLHGRETRPVYKALSSTMNPFIPGLSGMEDKCLGFLVNLGIQLKDDERWRSVADLSAEEKQKLFSQITMYLSSKGFPESSIFQLIGSVYTLLKEDKRTPLRDAREHASVLNSCSRMGRKGLGVSLCFQDRGEALEEAQNTLTEYRRTIANCMNSLLADRSRMNEMDNIITLKGHDIVDEDMLSPITTMLQSSISIKYGKPLIALTKAKNGDIKVSSRANEDLVRKGLNLGAIMQDAAGKLGGRGGGHNIAAGATIPTEKEEEFIQHVNRLTKEMIP